jgi:hypothetical protein
MKKATFTYLALGLVLEHGVLFGESHAAAPLEPHLKCFCKNVNKMYRKLLSYDAQDNLMCTKRF